MESPSVRLRLLFGFGTTNTLINLAFSVSVDNVSSKTQKTFKVKSDVPLGDLRDRACAHMELRTDTAELGYKLPRDKASDLPRTLSTDEDAASAIESMVGLVKGARGVVPILKIINMVCLFSLVPWAYRPDIPLRSRRRMWLEDLLSASGVNNKRRRRKLMVLSSQRRNSPPCASSRPSTLARSTLESTAGASSRLTTETRPGTIRS